MNTTMLRRITRHVRARDERGATATEYGVLMGFIAMLIVLGIGLFGTAVNGWFSRLATAVAGIL